MIKEEIVDDEETFQKSLLIILKELLNSTPEVRAAAILSPEGLPIVSALPCDINEIEIASLTATILSMAERASLKMQAGGMEQVFIQGSDRDLLVLNAGQNAVLTVSTTKNLNIGLIILNCKKVCEKIAKLV